MNEQGNCMTGQGPGQGGAGIEQAGMNTSSQGADSMGQTMGQPGLPPQGMGHPPTHHAPQMPPGMAYWPGYGFYPVPPHLMGCPPPGAIPMPPQMAGQMHGTRQTQGAGMAQVMEEIANGGNGLSGLTKMLDLDDKDFWKGALVGAAAVLLLTNGSIQKALFRGAVKGRDAVEEGVEKVKESVGKVKEKVRVAKEKDDE